MRKVAATLVATFICILQAAAIPAEKLKRVLNKQTVRSSLSF